jgi:hypothetical protein
MAEFKKASIVNLPNHSAQISGVPVSCLTEEAASTPQRMGKAYVRGFAYEELLVRAYENK